MITKHMTRRAFLAATAAVPALSSVRAEVLPTMVVTKDPMCGCCTGWAEHIREAGFPVEIVEVSDLARTKARLGVPQDLGACHTAEVGPYVVEGHVPANAVKRLLAERPQGTGLAVRGMPVGSPGMEIEGSTPDTFDVVLFGPAGRSVFERYEGARRL